MKEEEILSSIAMLREEWRQAREKKLLRKEELLSKGHGMAAVRHDRLYGDLRKRQHGCSVRIIHLERTMNRKRDLETEK